MEPSSPFLASPQTPDNYTLPGTVPHISVQKGVKCTNIRINVTLPILLPHTGMQIKPKEMQTLGEAQYTASWAYYQFLTLLLSRAYSQE